MILLNATIMDRDVLMLQCRSRARFALRVVGKAAPQIAPRRSLKYHEKCGGFIFMASVYSERVMGINSLSFCVYISQS